MTVGILDTFSPFFAGGFRLFPVISESWGDGTGLALLFEWRSEKSIRFETGVWRGA